MAEYDSAIRISTKVDTSQMQRLNIQIDKSVQKVQALEAEMKKLAMQKGTDAEMKALNNDITELTAKLRALEAEKAAMQNKPFMNHADIQRVNAEIEQTRKFLGEARREAESMTAAGRKYDEVANKYGYARQELQALVTRQDEMRAKADGAANSLKKCGSAGRNAFKEIKKHAELSDTIVGKFSKRVWGLAKRIFVFSLIARSFRAMVNALKDGLAGLSEKSDVLKKELAAWHSAVSSLKIAMVNIFGQILQVILPIITTIVNAIATAVKWIGNLLSMATGVSFTDAAAEQEKYADSLNGTAGAAKKANKELAQFDTLQVLQKKNEGGAGGAGMKVTPSDLSGFDKLAKIFDKIKTKAKELGNLFKNGFLAGFGDLGKLDRLKDAFNRLKTAAMAIFNDPKVQGAFNNMVNKAVYALGQIVGAAASIGVTLATNLVGGLAKYLEDNKDYITERLANIFDLQGAIYEKLGNFAQAFANVFEAFGGDNGQGLTAAIIGLFANAWLGAKEFVLRIGNDILDLLTRPFIENQEKFKAAFDGYLGAIKPAWEGLRDEFTAIFESVNTNYEKYVSPAFNKLTTAISNIAGKILDFYNSVILPVTAGIRETVGEGFAYTGQVIADYIEILMAYIGGLVSFVADLASGDWSAAWDDICGIVEVVVEKFKSYGFAMAQGLYNGFRVVLTGVVGIVNQVITAIEDMINKAIDTINKWIKNVVDALNSIPGVHISAPKISPIKIGRVPIPNLPDLEMPALANGAVIRGGNPFMAILGDQPSGQTNIETPLETMVQAFRMANGGSGGNMTINLNVNGQKFAQVTLDDFIEEMNRRGGLDLDIIGV